MMPAAMVARPPAPFKGTVIRPFTHIDPHLERSIAHPALDWSAAVGAGKERTLHMSLPPDRPATGRPLVGVEWSGPYRGPAGEHETVAEHALQTNIGSVYWVKEEIGNALNPGVRLWAHTHRTARQDARYPDSIVDPDGIDPDAFTYQWVRVLMTAERPRKPTGTETDIPDATGRQYTLTADDVGHRIKLRVTARDVLGGGCRSKFGPWRRSKKGPLVDAGYGVAGCPGNP